MALKTHKKNAKHTKNLNLISNIQPSVMQFFSKPVSSPDSSFLKQTDGESVTATESVGPKFLPSK